MNKEISKRSIEELLEDHGWMIYYNMFQLGTLARQLDGAVRAGYEINLKSQWEIGSPVFEKLEDIKKYLDENGECIFAEVKIFRSFTRESSDDYFYYWNFKHEEWRMVK